MCSIFIALIEKLICCYTIVKLLDKCGETVVLGESSVNGFVSLQSDGDVTGSIPNSCEVELVAGKGLSLHIRLIVCFYS